MISENIAIEQANKIDMSMRISNGPGNLEYPVVIYQSYMSKLHSGYLVRHWHEDLELFKCVKGSIEATIGGDTVILREGDIVYINQNVIHTLAPYECQDAEFAAVIFSPNFVIAYGKSFVHTKYLLPVISNAALPFVHFENGSEAYAQLSPHFNAIIEDNTSQSFAYEMKSKINISSIWIQLLNIYLKENTLTVPNSFTLSEDRTKKATEFIQENYADPITLDQIAEAIHVSKSECCRCFKKIMRLSPFEYLMKYRIFMAAIKISQDTTRSIPFSDIASQTGFNNVSYFNKLFKQYLDCTPSEYRRARHTKNIDSVEKFFPNLLE